jgi:hypothetical protein
MRITLSICMLLCMRVAYAQTPKDTERLAQNAQTLSQEALKRKEWTTAKILLMNAYNRQPENIGYLSSLYEFNRQHEHHDTQAISELIELMERALYLIAPQHVMIVLQYIEQLETRRDQTLKSTPNSHNISNQVKTLTRLKIKSSASAYQEITSYLNDLSEVLSHYPEGLSENQRVKLNDQHTRLSRYRRLLDLSKELTRYVSLLRKTVVIESPRAQARTQMISNTLNIIYSEDLESLPISIKGMVNSVLISAEQTVKDHRTTIAQQHYATSVTIYNIFIKQYNTAVKSNRMFQQVITKGTEVIESLRRLQMKMQDSSLLTQASKLIEQTHGFIRHALEAQRILYNRWAAERCLTALKLIDAEVSLSDAEAISIFEKNTLAKLDARHLSPEVSSIYHHLVQVILKELPASKAIPLQRELMTAEKRRLDSF